MQTQKYVAELIGTFLLVFVGTSAIVGFGGAFAGTPAVATVGFLGIALAFGLTLTVLAYTLGPISGGHFNPAVTIGLVAARRHSAKDLAPYVVCQIIGAILASAVLYVIASGVPGWTIASPGGLGQNTFGSLALTSAILAEVVLTFVLVWTVLAVTEKNYTNAAFSGLAIGLTLLVIHLAGIGFTSAGVNPARSIGPAILVGGAALQQLWVFIVAPIVGGLVAAGAYTALATTNETPVKSPAKARA
ncbi:MAG TPA: MIP family channel protein [Candidatus Thermoplasmatota archaeon]|jgi:aquaporin Z|nr:MIP family channel protein [Candidatus Thermoplasmatota archaeon]